MSISNLPCGGLLPLVYLIRVWVAKDNLKEWLYPNIRAVTKDVDVWHGWKCAAQDDVKNAFDEIEAGLQKYLAEQAGSQ